MGAAVACGAGQVRRRHHTVYASPPPTFIVVTFPLHQLAVSRPLPRGVGASFRRNCDRGIRDFWGGQRAVGASHLQRDLQIHTNIFLPVKTVPILDAFRLRGDPREQAARYPHGLCGDWPSLLEGVRSLAHRSCQGHYICRQRSWLHAIANYDSAFARKIDWGYIGNIDSPCPSRAGRGAMTVRL